MRHLLRRAIPPKWDASTRVFLLGRRLDTGGHAGNDRSRTNAVDRHARSTQLDCETLRQTDNASLIISNVDRVGFGISEALRGLAIVFTLLGLGFAALIISPHIAIASAATGIAVLFAYRGMRRRAEELRSGHRCLRRNPWR